MQQINLYSGEWYAVDSPLIFFIGNNVRVKNIEIIEDVIKKLTDSQVLVIGNYRQVEDSYSFGILLDDFFLMCRRSEKNNFSVTYMESLAQIKSHGRKAAFYNKPILNIIPRKKLLVILQNVDSQGNFKYDVFPQGYLSRSWDMAETAIASIDQKIRSYFEAGEESGEGEQYKIGHSFRRKILDRIRDYTYYEDENEKFQVMQGSSLFYTKRISTTDSSKLKNYTYQFFCPAFDDETFTVDARVSVESSIKDYYGNCEFIDGVIIDILIGDDETIVEISFSRQFNDSDIPPTGRIVLRHNPVQRRVREDVLAAIEKGEILSTYMYKTFNTFETEGFEQGVGWEEFERELDSPKDGFKPNESQKEAIRKGIETRDLLLVLGPPGTGKTTVIVAWVEFFVRHGMKVLVSSQNNMAVDNVLSRVSKNPDVEIIRIGNESKVQEGVKPFLPERRDRALYEKFQETFRQNRINFQKDLHKLNSMEEVINTVLAYLTECERIENALGQVYAGIASELEKQNKLYSIILSSEQRLNEIIEAIARKLIYLEETAKSHIVIRALRFIYTVGVKRDLSRLQTEFNKIRSEYVEQVRRYNQRFANIIDSLKKPELQNLKNRYNQLLEQLAPYRELKVEFDSPYSTITYELETEELSLSIAELDEFRAKCMESKANIEKASAALDEWEASLKAKRNEIMTNILIESANVVGATCIGINTNRKFADVDFDVAIIDEAGQIQVHNIIVPMTRAKKNLLLGDYLQIPPIVNDKVAELCKLDGVPMDLLEMSFFEYLFTKTPLPEENKTMLKWQFRMPAEIADIVSHQFYNDQYFSVDAKKNLGPLCPQMFSRPLAVIDTGDFADRRETPHKEGGYFNSYEAEIILLILKKIFEGKEAESLSPKDIGIIAPYKKQVQHIKKTLKSKLTKLSPEEIDEMVATLDSFQGQERKMIIYSFTRSNTRPSNTPRIGFLSELRRLNVAFTRCLKQLVIIGDMDFLSSCEYEEKGEDGQPLPNRSEREFSRFIKYLVDRVMAGAGQLISSREFLKRASGD